MSVFCYVRVSSKGQVVNGQSIPQQTRELLSYAAKRKWELSPHSFQSGSPGVCVDPGCSAWRESPLFLRPAFAHILLHAKPGDRIISTTLDRAFRSVRNFSETWPAIEKKGLVMSFIQQDIDTSTAWGTCKAHLLAVFAQLKSDLISQRTKEGIAAKKAGIVIPKRARDMLRMEVDSLTAFDMPPPANKSEPGKGRVFSYARCSSWDQTVASQIPQLREMVDTALQDGYSYGGSFSDEGVSAYSVMWQDRPAGGMLWSKLERGDIICVARIDRAFRSLVDMAKCWTSLKDRGIGLRIETGSGRPNIGEDDECMLKIMVAMAEMESADISRRVKSGMAAARALKGKRYSRSHLPWWQDIAVKGDKWSFIPNLQALSEFDEILTLTEDEGHTKVAASDIMEEKICMRDQRTWIPEGQSGIPLKRYLRYKAKRYPRHWIKNLERHAVEDEKRMHSFAPGRVRRTWTAKRITQRMESREDIDIMYERDPSIKQLVEGWNDG